MPGHAGTRTLEAGRPCRAGACQLPGGGGDSPLLFRGGPGEASEPWARVAYAASGGAPPDRTVPHARHVGTGPARIIIEPPPGLEPLSPRPPGGLDRPVARAHDEPVKIQMSALATAPPATEPVLPPQEQQRRRGRPADPPPGPRSPPELPRGERWPHPAEKRVTHAHTHEHTRVLRRATLVIAYFPRAASDEEVCLALDGAVGSANSVLRCEVVREGGLYGFFEFADEELAELALQACNNGKLIMRDHMRKKWFLHASRSRHVTLGNGTPGGPRGKVRAPRVQVHARDKSDDQQDDSDASTAPGSGRTRSASSF